MNKLASTTIAAVALAIAIVPWSTSRAAGSGGAVTGTVKIDQDGKAKSDRSRIVVYLEGVPGALSDAAKAKHAIRQKDTQFDPFLTVVVKGTTIDFPNEDKIFHNVFSLSDPAKFDLGLYKQGTSKSVTFKRAGVVDIYCNIHPDMVAKVVVLDTTYYQVTAADGKFELKNVPAGKYTLVAWQARGAESRTQVTVTDGGVAKVEPALVEGKAPKAHVRKDGTVYGRYN